jgi:hypothetical protein
MQRQLTKSHAMHAHDRRTNTRGVSLLAGAAILALVPAVLPRQTHPAPEPAPRCSRRPRRRATGCTTAAVATTPGSPPHCRSAPGAPGWSPPRPRKWKITRKTRRPGVAVESEAEAIKDDASLLPEGYSHVTDRAGRSRR